MTPGLKRLLLGLTLFCAGAAVAQPSPGLAADRIGRVASFMRSATDENGYLGAVTLVAHRGRIVDWQAFGHRDLARSVRMQRDDIFRIYSMSKMVATIAVLMLMEEGRLALDDPLAKHLPGFAKLQVLAAGSADAPMLRAPVRPLTVRHLLTHTAGFATGGAGIEQASLLLERADLPASADLEDFAGRVARVPLATDPGERFRYDGVQIEVLSRLVEVLSGLPFDRYLKQRLFDPLGMGDTGFEVPPQQRHRVVDITAMGPAGRLVLAAGRSAVQPGVRLNPYFSGAGGLYSTAGDYARLCAMLLGGGSLDGVAILGRKTVELMMMNHLVQTKSQSDPQRDPQRDPKRDQHRDPQPDPQPSLPSTQFNASEGFGLGGSVVVDVARHGRLSSVGAFGWLGAASTYYTVDRQEQLVAILLLQHLPRDGVADLPKLQTSFYNLVYQALVP